MDFERFKKINDERLNYREIEDASVVSSYRNTGCGDGYRLYLKIDEGDPEKRVIDASYTTTGCGFGLVSLAMATEWVKGKSLQKAGEITVEDIENEFNFPPRRKNYPASAVECLRKAVSDYRSGTGIDPKDRVSRKSALEKLKKQKHLRNADLRQVILEGENLQEVDLSGADLSHAFLTNCSLKGAKLKKARLRGAFLNNADLTGADLREADLRWAKLTGAQLKDVRMNNAVYDVGTRLDPRHNHLFAIMQRGKGMDIYMQKEEKSMKEAKKSKALL